MNKPFQKKALEKMKADESDKRHGTSTGYDYGCRCDRCRKAHAEHMAKYRARKKWKEAELADQEERLEKLQESAKSQIVEIHGIGRLMI